jgi:preprotein translocase subunit SecG
MIFLKALLIVVEVLSCLLLIGLVLLQKSKSEGLGLAFGAGTGESLFGARAGNVLSKVTVTLGVVFMACSLALGYIFAQQDQTWMDAAEPVAQAIPVMEAPLDITIPEAEVVEVAEVAPEAAAAPAVEVVPVEESTPSAEPTEEM